MRGAAMIIGVAGACVFACAAPVEHDQMGPAEEPEKHALETIKEQLTLFFPMNESEGAEHIDSVNQLALASWQRTRLRRIRCRWQRHDRCTRGSWTRPAHRWCEGLPLRDVHCSSARS